MWKNNQVRILALGLIVVAAAIAIFVGISFSTHAVPVKHVQASNELASAPSAGSGHSASASHPYVGPCRKCLAAHPYEARVLGVAPLAS